MYQEKASSFQPGSESVVDELTNDLASARFQITSTVASIRAQRVVSEEDFLRQFILNNNSIPRDVRYAIQCGGLPENYDDGVLRIGQDWIWNRLSEIKRVEWGRETKSITVFYSDGTSKRDKIDWLPWHFTRFHASKIESFTPAGKEHLNRVLTKHKALYAGEYEDLFEEGQIIRFSPAGGKGLSQRFERSLTMVEFSVKWEKKLSTFSPASQNLVIGLLSSKYDPDSHNLNRITDLSEDSDHHFVRIIRRGMDDEFLFHLREFSNGEEYAEMLAELYRDDFLALPRHVADWALNHMAKCQGGWDFDGKVLGFKFSPTTGIVFDYRGEPMPPLYPPMPPEEFIELYLIPAFIKGEISSGGYTRIVEMLHKKHEEWCAYGLPQDFSETPEGVVKMGMATGKPLLIFELQTLDAFYQEFIKDNFLLSEDAKRSILQKLRRGEITEAPLKGAVRWVTQDTEKNTVVLHTIFDVNPIVEYPIEFELPPPTGMYSS